MADFTLGAGETASFVLEEAVEGQSSISARPEYPAEPFKRTTDFWRGWLARSTYRGRWREMVDRSALALKLLTSRPTARSSRRPPSGCPRRSAASATGTTATRGSATARSRSTA